MSPLKLHPDQRGRRIQVGGRRAYGFSSGDKGHDVATTNCVKLSINATLPPDAQYAFSERVDGFAGGAVTVTAIPTLVTEAQVFESLTFFIEVIQMATRLQWNGERGGEWWLDLVVRNNAHESQPDAQTIGAFDLYVSWVTP